MPTDNLDSILGGKLHVIDTGSDSRLAMEVSSTGKSAWVTSQEAGVNHLHLLLPSQLVALRDLLNRLPLDDD